MNTSDSSTMFDTGDRVRRVGDPDTAPGGTVRDTIGHQGPLTYPTRPRVLVRWDDGIALWMFRWELRPERPP